ncbi:hypothetical protein DPMN_163361 [Dreissena polymorpha]|uniref:C1q domain-containing protein n=1 Tax=Dreissena polymorpha TaxID=45954 RepID=A0A9D4EVM1_DREPO|nr:hypothetical protein DPMN_163361 [Dreissena polymorpha]
MYEIHVATIASNITDIIFFLTGRKEAFTAVKTKTQTNIGRNDMIVFETVVFNEGNAYAPNQGFVAKSAGDYSFTLTVAHDSHPDSLHAGIMLDGQIIAIAQSTKGMFDQGSQTVIVHMHPGQRVWVQSLDYSNQFVYGDLYSAFSGFLLQRD